MATSKLATGERPSVFRPLTCWLFCLIAALPFVFVTPPFQSPDENRHFFRAYQLSEGTLFPYRRPSGAVEGDTVRPIHGDLGGMLPRAVEQLLVATDAERLRFRPDQRIPPIKIWESLGIRIDSSDRRYFRFPHTLVYPPYAYLSQALGIAISRFVTDRILIQFYAARFSNLLLASFLFFLAAAIAPSLIPGFLAFWSLPLVLFQSASVGIDGIVHAGSVLLVATVFRAGPASLRIASSATGSLALLASKLAYVPLALPLVVQRHLTLRSRLIAIAIPLGLLLAWLLLTARLATPLRTDLNLDPQAQIRALLTDPAAVAAVLGADLYNNLAFYARSLFGILGWLDRPIPLTHIALSTLLLAASTIILSCRTDGLSLVAIGIGAVSSIVLVQLALWVSFTVPGSSTIPGIQGRYFLPLMPFALAVAGSFVGTLRSSKALEYAYLGGLLFSGALTLSFVARSYYG